jgi:tetratricopeptide (TPR) repeat protein
MRFGFRTDKGKILRRAAAAAAVAALIAGGTLIFLWKRSGLDNRQKELMELWDRGLYEETYASTGEELERNPMDYFLLNLHGFSAYRMAQAQINHTDTQYYTDRCIWSLRKALLVKGVEGQGGIFYVLGRAYYLKGEGYADLAVKYLEAARSASYMVSDIPEYLGLAYTQIKDYRSSVAAFILALRSAEREDVSSSDMLLLSIAQAYIAMEERENATAYLIRCLELSRDSEAKITARLLLGNIFFEAKDYEEARRQYLSLIEENGENADAHYHLGEIYAQTGDNIRARAEWRRAVAVDPAHRQSRIRLNM